MLKTHFKNFFSWGKQITLSAVISAMAFGISSAKADEQACLTQWFHQNPTVENQNRLLLSNEGSIIEVNIGRKATKEEATKIMNNPSNLIVTDCDNYPVISNLDTLYKKDHGIDSVFLHVKLENEKWTIIDVFYRDENDQIVSLVHGKLPNNSSK